MSWDIDLAKELKKRDNAEPIGAILGEVISIEPIKISILGNKAILDNSNIYLCSKVTGVIKGDKVLCLPTADEQTFFIVDKVVG